MINISYPIIYPNLQSYRQIEYYEKYKNDYFQMKNQGVLIKNFGIYKDIRQYITYWEDYWKRQYDAISLFNKNSFTIVQMVYDNEGGGVGDAGCYWWIIHDSAPLLGFVGAYHAAVGEDRDDCVAKINEDIKFLEERNRIYDPTPNSYFSTLNELVSWQNSFIESNRLYPWEKYMNCDCATENDNNIFAEVRQAFIDYYLENIDNPVKPDFYLVQEQSTEFTDFQGLISGENMWPGGVFDSQYVFNLGHYVPMFLQIDRNLTLRLLEELNEPGLLACRLSDESMTENQREGFGKIRQTTKNIVVVIPDLLAFERTDYKPLNPKEVKINWVKFHREAGLKKNTLIFLYDAKDGSISWKTGFTVTGTRLNRTKFKDVREIAKIYSISRWLYNWDFSDTLGLAMSVAIPLSGFSRKVKAIGYVASGLF